MQTLCSDRFAVCLWMIKTVIFVQIFSWTDQTSACSWLQVRSFTSMNPNDKPVAKSITFGGSNMGSFLRLQSFSKAMSQYWNVGMGHKYTIRGYAYSIYQWIQMEL